MAAAPMLFKYRDNKQSGYMKSKYYYLLFLVPVMQGCVANSQTGQMEPGWVFWVLLGLLLGGIFIGALVNLLRKKRPDGAPTKAEQEMEAYEETLEKKLKENSEEESKDKK